MDLNWLQSIAYGFLSGLMDILPVSAQAHRVLLLKVFGVTGKSDLFALMIHLGVFAGLYFSCNAHIVRMSRARRLSRVPKKKRKRPLDTKSLMDSRLLGTMLVGVILCLFGMRYTGTWGGNLLIVSLFLFLNGIILYAPQFFSTGNRDSRNLSRVEGLLMGLGGAASAFPGISAMAAATSVASVCGVERSYGLTMVLLMNMFLNLGYAAMDIYGIFSGGAGQLGFLLVLRYIFTGLMAFAGTWLGVRLMRQLASGKGYALLGLYSMGMALFLFVLNLLA